MVGLVLGSPRSFSTVPDSSVPRLQNQRFTFSFPQLPLTSRHTREIRRPSNPMASAILLTPLRVFLHKNSKATSSFTNPFAPRSLQFLTIKPLSKKTHVVTFSAEDRDDHISSPNSPPTSSSQVGVVVSEEENATKPTDVENASSDSDEKTQLEQQEMDWKADDEFKRFMGNPSIEAAIKLEKKGTHRKLRELDRELDQNPISWLIKREARDNLIREKKRLEKAEEAFKALDLNKQRSCFGFDTFFSVDAWRFGDGGIFVGNLRRPIKEVSKVGEEAFRGSWTGCCTLVHGREERRCHKTSERIHGLCRATKGRGGSSV